MYPTPARHISVLPLSKSRTGNTPAMRDRSTHGFHISPNRSATNKHSDLPCREERQPRAPAACRRPRVILGAEGRTLAAARRRFWVASALRHAARAAPKWSNCPRVATRSWIPRGSSRTRSARAAPRGPSPGARGSTSTAPRSRSRWLLTMPTRTVSIRVLIHRLPGTERSPQSPSPESSILARRLASFFLVSISIWRAIWIRCACGEPAP
jgi:hypothetical protein